MAPIVVSPAIAWTLALLLGLILLLIVLGQRLSRAVATLGGYYLADFKLSWRWVAFSFAASWFGAASTLATLDATVQRGLNGLWDIALPSFVSCVLIALWMGPAVARWCARHASLSMPEAIATVYGPVGRWGFAVIILMATVTMLAAQLVAAGGVFHALLGLPWGATVVGFSVVVATYATLGGYCAVVLTDVLQLALIVVGLSVPLVWLIGQFPTVLPLTVSVSKELTPTALQLGTVVTFVMGWIIAPEMWQRMQSLATPKHATRTVWLAGGCLALLYGLVVMVGLLARAWVGPAMATAMTPATGVMWGKLAIAMPHPLLTALMMLGVTCAIGSTMDSSLNVGSLAMAHDVVQPIVQQVTGRPLPERWHIVLARGATLLMMAIAVGVALCFHDLLHILWMSADCYATVMLIPLLAVLFLPRPSKVGGLAAMITGASVTLILRLLPMVGVVLPELLTWPWATWWGVAASALAYGLGASLTRRQSETA